MGKKKPIVTPFGQWEYPGEVTIIPSNNITMQGVNYPVLGIDNLGNQELMMPGMDYTFPGDYVTEIPQMGKGGLTQWFAEEWTDIKTGKPCGRSGKDKDGRPYPACRPKKRVNETTPKTTSEMSSAEKAKFKREKTSGKRIDYNHKRKQQGGQWYTTQEWDDAMPDSTAENIVEFFDPTGYTSHDDARRAYQKWKKSGSTLPSFEQGMDMFGAVPALGKLGKLKYLADPDAMKAVYKYLPWQQIINAADTVQDEVEKKKYGGWLDNYQKGGETSTEQNPTRIAPVDIRVKRKKISDSNRYMYDTEGNLVYNPSLTIYPEIAKGSTKGETTFQPNIPVNLLNPTLEELVNVAASYYPIDNRLTSGDRINLPASNFQTSLEQDYILPQMVGRSFGNLPLNKGNTIDDGYGPNRIWTTNLNQNPGNYFLNSPETYAYILKGDKSSLVDYDQSVGYDKKQQVESGMSNLNQRFDEALATQGYNIEMVDDYTANRPDQIWNRAEQTRVEMLNNPEIREWAKLHNLDLSNKYRSKYDRNNKNIKTTETDDNFASKIPESIYASRLAQAGLPTNRPDYYYGGRKTFVIQDPSKFNLAGYFPIDQEMINSGRQMGEYVNDSSANLKNIMAERMGIDPKKFDNGEYLIHYNRSPISEYTPGKKYGGWLNQYQEGGETSTEQNPDRMQEIKIAATSPGVKTFANTLFDGGKWLAKNFIKYHPGLRFTTKVLGTGLNYFKDEVFDKYRPIEYPDVLDAIIKLNNPSVEPLKDKKGNLSPSEEAWRKGLGFKDDFKYIKPASYKPANSEDNDTEYVRFENMYDPQKLINAYVKAQKELKPGETKVLIPSLDPYIKGRKNLEASGVAFSQQDPLQNFTLDKGEDEKGKYISLYDVYDFGPLITDLVYGFKKPYEVYDRFYYEKNKQGIPVYKKKDGGQTNWLKKYK
jgi:hypothetical protein